MSAQDASAGRFDFGRVLGRIFDLIGRNFISFFLISLVFSGIPYVVTGFILPPAAVEPINLGNVAGQVAVMTLISLIGSILLQGALTRASLDDLSGKGVSIGAALGTALGLFLPLLGLAILVGLGVMVGFLFLIIPGVILALRWMVVAPVLVAERTGVFKAMERSAQLTRGHWGPILGLALLYAVLVIMAAGVTGGFAAAGAATPSALLEILSMALQVLASMLSTVGVASIYFELRQIKEGIGVAEIAAVFE